MRSEMRRGSRIGPAALLSLAVAVGCGHVISGAPMRAAAAVDELPTEYELTAAVGNGLSTFDFQPFFGGLDITPDGFRDDADASPFRCAGVTETMLRATYEGADAAEVRCGSAAAARDRHRAFAEQWRGCDAGPDGAAVRAARLMLAKVAARK